MASIESLRISFFSINWFKFITLLMSFVSKAKIRPTLEFCPVFVSKLLRWTLMFFSYPWNFPCTVTPSTPGFTHLDVGAPDDGDSRHNNRSTRTKGWLSVRLWSRASHRRFHSVFSLNLYSRRRRTLSHHRVRAFYKITEAADGWASARTQALSQTQSVALAPINQGLFPASAICRLCEFGKTN